MRALALIAIAGCGETALDLELMPDVNVNTVEQVLERVGSAVIVVDSPDGLYPRGAEESDDELVQIKNADSDPEDLELVAQIAIGDHLPLVRLERGGLADVPLDIRVLGLGRDGKSAAAGEVRGVRYSSGEVAPLSIPFNVLPRLLPPRIVEVSPADGDVLIDCQVELVIAVFSKEIVPGSLLAGDRFELAPLAGAAMTATVGLESRIARFVPAGDLGLAYRMFVSEEVIDLEDRQLDQIAAEDGPQPFSEEFHLACSGQSEIPPCSAGTPAGYCPGRFVCAEGVCRPSGCDGAACPLGFACDPATALCEIDCRLYGDTVCPGDRPACGAAGACEPR